MKKIILIVVIALAVVTLSVVGVLYYLSSKQQPASSGTPVGNGLVQGNSIANPDAQNANQNGSTPPATVVQEKPPVSKKVAQENTIRTKLISSRPVIFTALSPDGKSLFYFDAESGKFFRQNLENVENGSPEALSEAEFKNVTNVVWSAGRNMAVITTVQDDGARKNILLSFADQKQQEIDSHFQDITFSPAEDKILYRYVDDTASVANISVANPDGTKWSQVVGYRGPAPVLTWYAKNGIAYYPVPSVRNKGSIYLTNTDGSADFRVAPNSYGVEALWSPHGTKMLYTATPDPGTETNLFVGTADREMSKMTLLKTVLTKCAWAADDSFAFCGVPTDESVGRSALPDDYYAGGLTTNDELYVILPMSGETIKIGNASQYLETLDIYKPVFSLNNRVVFFTNRADGKFYALILPQS